MAQTISELEKERAELLRKIEEEARLAKQYNQQGESNNEAENELSLNDFLKAAQEVIPDEPTPILSETSRSNKRIQEGRQQDTMVNTRRTTRRSSKSNNPTGATSSSQEISNSQQKSAFFGVVIMLTLLLTTLGVMGLVYITLKESIDQLNDATQTQKQGMDEIVKKINQLDSKFSIKEEGGGTALEQKIVQLTQKVQALETKLEKLEGQGKALSVVPPKLDIPRDTVITAELLDQKFALYSHYLEKRLEKKLDLILRYVATNTDTVPSSNSQQETSKKSFQLQRRVKETESPKVSTPQTPKVEKTLKPTEPVVTLVKPVQSPQKPNQPSAYYTEDTIWLSKQPLFNYTLQLASMTDKHMLIQFKQRKKLSQAKIIPQKRSGQMRYVLIDGSYATRSEAENRARQINRDIGVSPWIRKVKDLTARLP